LIEVDFEGWNSKVNEHNKFSKIRDAIINSHVIRFDYVNAGGERSNRSAEPVKLIFNAYTWYLLAYCLLRNSQRLFRLSRIRDVQVTQQHFTRRDIQECQEQGTRLKLVDLKLRCDERVLSRLYDTFDSELITKNDNGSYDLCVALPEDEWLYGYILSFGAYSEVLEPQHIREIIKSRAKEILENTDTFLKYDIQLSRRLDKIGETIQEEGGVNIELSEQKSQIAVAIKREKATMAQISTLATEGLQKVFGFLARNGVEIAGAPFLAYSNSNADFTQFDVELGIPVGEAIAVDGEFVMSKTCEGKAVWQCIKGHIRTLMLFIPHLCSTWQRTNEKMDTTPNKSNLSYVSLSNPSLLLSPPASIVCRRFLIVWAIYP